MAQTPAPVVDKCFSFSHHSTVLLLNTIFAHVLRFKRTLVDMSKGVFLEWRRQFAPGACSVAWMEWKTYHRRPSGMECGCKPENDEKMLCGEGLNCLNRITETYCNHHSCKNQMPADCFDIDISDCGDKGWGITAKTPISDGTFLCEYLGEEIDRNTVLELNKIGQGNYIIAFDNKYIDARRRGNLSRFFNHSCDPNCELLKKVHGERPCVVIVAKGEIPAKKELTINYGWDASIKCLCGAATCRGSIGKSGKGRSQDIQMQNNQEELVRNPVLPAVSKAAVSATDRGGPHVSNVGGVPNNFGDDSYQQSMEQQTRASPENYKQTKRRNRPGYAMRPRRPSSAGHVQASLVRSPHKSNTSSRSSIRAWEAYRKSGQPVSHDFLLIVEE